MTYLDVLAGTASVIGLVVCILACARKKASAAELDTVTPLPGPTPDTLKNGKQTSSIAPAGVYQDANVAETSSVGVGSCYEDVPQQARASQSSHTGLPLSRSMDSRIMSGVAPSRSLPAVGRLASSVVMPGIMSQPEEEEYEPRPAVPPKTQASEILYDATTGPSALDYDGEPPPAVPPKTAEAALIYGENIPMSVRNELEAAAAVAVAVPPPVATPPQPQALSSSMSTRQQTYNPPPALRSVNSLPPGLGTPNLPGDDEDTDEPAPVLPPKTAEAELLYDYCDGVKVSPKGSPLAPATKYIEVAFAGGDAAGGGTLPSGEGNSMYADVSVQ